MVWGKREQLHLLSETLVFDVESSEMFKFCVQLIGEGSVTFFLDFLLFTLIIYLIFNLEPVDELQLEYSQVSQDTALL